MHLEIDPDGGLTGTYVSAVGEAAGRYLLVGRYDTTPEAGHGTTLGWSVSWRNDLLDANSVTGWSGQYHDGQEERISTLWLLTVETKPADSWESTFVGQDVFTRTPPEPAEVERRLRLGVRASHPLRSSASHRR
jgi:hypothetical protein